MKSNAAIIQKPGDKGSVVVIMVTGDYVAEGMSHLSKINFTSKPNLTE